LMAFGFHQASTTGAAFIIILMCALTIETLVSVRLNRECLQLFSEILIVGHRLSKIRI